MSSSTKLNFHIIDVFTTTKYSGNPLAIVQIPKSLSSTLTHEQKQLIAREFNLSETVFMHETPSNEVGASSLVPVKKIDIFTTDGELPFAGHPTVGSSWFLLAGPGQDEKSRKEEIILQTKAGKIPASLVNHQTKSNNKVKIQIPTDFKQHQPIPLPTLKSVQPNLQESDYTNGLKNPEVVVSIVKGVNYILLNLNSENALGRMQNPNENIEVSWLGDWQGFVGLYVFYEKGDGVVRTRMFAGNLEDPATGSAAAALGGWLGKRKGPGKWTFEVIQGVEMGRRSDIEVIVEVGEDGELKKIELGGSAVEVAEGSVAL